MNITPSIKTLGIPINTAISAPVFLSLLSRIRHLEISFSSLLSKTIRSLPQVKSCIILASSYLKDSYDLPNLVILFFNRKDIIR